MRFVDLFAGLGGFHQALAKLGHECVFASEMNAELARVYELNFGIKPFGDIREHHQSVPSHDILCAGFPCQPFSKAGDQLGFDCPQWGDLFDYVVDILECHKTPFLIIENVPNLMRHKDGETWKRVCGRLENAGYDISSTKLSPHMFGIPQTRDRAIIVGARAGLDHFSWPEAKKSLSELSIKSILDVSPVEAKALPAHFVNYLSAWQDLISRLPPSEPLPSFPIWAMEFGATYSLDSTPYSGGYLQCENAKGAFGRSLQGMSAEQVKENLPAYARDETQKFPRWKVQFIEQNRAFYQKHKEVIDAWLPTISTFAASFQKLEWNWKGGPRDLWQAVIQFRASGIRAKRPTAAPSLVALTTSQVPVIAWERRYMTIRECARLQSMGDLVNLPSGQGSIYKALGNAVNVDVIRAVAERLILEDIAEVETETQTEATALEGGPVALAPA